MLTCQCSVLSKKAGCHLDQIRLSKHNLIIRAQTMTMSPKLREISPINLPLTWPGECVESRVPLPPSLHYALHHQRYSLTSFPCKTSFWAQSFNLLMATGNSCLLNCLSLHCCVSSPLAGSGSRDPWMPAQLPLVPGLHLSGLSFMLCLTSLSSGKPSLARAGSHSQPAVKDLCSPGLRGPHGHLLQGQGVPRSIPTNAEISLLQYDRTLCVFQNIMPLTDPDSRGKEILSFARTEAFLISLQRKMSEKRKSLSTLKPR